MSVLLSIFVLANPETTSKALANIYTILSIKFETIFLYGSFLILVFLLILAISRYGSLTITIKNKNNYNMISWCSMLFAAGIGATLLYWSTIEWIEYFNILSSDSSFDKDKLCNTPHLPIFHWGPTAWAIYCLPVVAFGLAITKTKLLSYIFRNFKH